MKHFLFFIRGKKLENSNMAKSDCKLTFLNPFFYMTMSVLKPIWLHGAAVLNEYSIFSY